MKLLNFNIIYLTVFLILGIVIQHYFNLSLIILIVGFVLGLVLSLLSVHIPIRKKNRDRLHQLFISIVFISIGSLLLSLKTPQNIPNHYTKLITNEEVEFTLKIEKRLKPNAFNEKYYAQVVSIDSRQVVGKILLSVSKDCPINPIPIDGLLITKNKVEDIHPPLNPHGFNYAGYLRNYQISHQIYASKESTILISTEPTRPYGYADLLRRIINSKLKTAGFNETSIQMINALLLGQKQDIDPDIYNSYINVGTVHILAVSGLHVGIILWILTILFKPLLLLRYGRYFRVLLILFLLWSFAFIAGLSPSVTRAVTMFSIVSIALHLKRETNIFNTLVTSAFLLLLFNPNYLFEVGFQLSYTAVLSIVSFQPMICGVWQPKFKIVNYLWQIFGVTLAAQFGVAPLSLFYFHQFPGLFFISNLVIIPFLGIILGFGLLVIILSLSETIPIVLVKGFETIIELLNGFIYWVSNFESFLLKDISFNQFHLVFAYLVIISIYWAYKSKNYKWVYSGLLALLVVQSHNSYNRLNSKQNELIVFHKSQYSVIGIKTDKFLTLYSNMNDSLLQEQNFVKDYVVEESINTWNNDSIKSVFQFNDKTILVIDSLGIYRNLTFNPEIVIMSSSPKVNLERIINLFNPELVVADGSNYRSYTYRWKETCLNKKTTFHNTAKDGAFICMD